jgi:hypothetical protein
MASRLAQTTAETASTAIFGGKGKKFYIEVCCRSLWHRTAWALLSMITQYCCETMHSAALGQQCMVLTSPQQERHGYPHRLPREHCTTTWS